MARRCVKDLSSGETIDGEVYLLTQKDLRTTTNGSLYIHAVLADKTGQMPARMWQATQELYALIPQDGFVSVRGRTESYKGSLQFIIEGIQPVKNDAVDVEEFLPQTERDIDAMAKRLVEILRGIKDKRLLYLMKRFVDDRELMERFKRAPAAVQNHHACIGGLLEHTLNVLELVLLVGPRYPGQLNMDLLLAGGFLHDIGKTAELKWDGAFKYTDGGQLIGHLVMAASLIEQKAREAEDDLGKPLPQRLIEILQHIVISHHGDYEFGSPKLPMTAEAMVMHYLDNLDAKLDLFRRQVDQSDQSDPEVNWTGFIRSLDRKLFKGDAFDASDEAG